jgi:CheY-like chemotaxis protein
VATSFTPTSDERLKKNIQTLDDALECVEKLRGASFDWRMPEERDIGQGLTLPTREHQIGVIAQEVEQVFPEAVGTDNNGVKNVNYNSLVAPLIEAIKEQQERSPYHIVFLDWEMPQISGFDILSHFRKLKPFAGTAFVMLTSVSETPEVLRAVKAGANTGILSNLSPMTALMKGCGVLVSGSANKNR